MKVREQKDITKYSKELKLKINEKELKMKISDYVTDVILDSQINLAQLIKHNFNEYNPEWLGEDTTEAEAQALKKYVEEIINNLFRNYK